MSKTLSALCVVAPPLLLAAAPAPALLDTIDIQIAPQAFQLGRAQGGEVVVHTNIDFSDVNAATVYLEGIAAEHCKADNCGDLVAYFDEDTIEALVAPPSATLTLTGERDDGTPFSGTDTVTVTVWRGR
jgi:hypothetical protein